MVHFVARYPGAMPTPENIPEISAEDAAALARLEPRFGAAAVHRRLALEAAHEARRLAQAARPLPLETWHKTPALIRAALRLSGLTP